MAKAKTIKAAPVLKSEGGRNAEELTREYITVRGKLATYVMEINLAGSTFNAYIVDNDGHEYDVDADINAY